MKPDLSMNRAFEGKTVVLTGAASGIGRSLAIQLRLCGAEVYALDLNAEGLNSLAEESKGPGKIHVKVIDISDFDAYANLVDSILRDSPKIDYLFNNAGVTLLGELQNLPFEKTKALLNINLMGTIYGTQLIYPNMIKNMQGYIVNTASIAGSTGYATACAYSASKTAVLEFSRSLRAEARQYGVKVSVVCPGYVDSSIFTQDRVYGADCEAMVKDLPVKMMTPDFAANQFLRGVAKNKKTIIFPVSAKFLWYLSCWSPSLLGVFQRRFLRTFRPKP